jgi:hypothetical protein
MNDGNTGKMTIAKYTRGVVIDRTGRHGTIRAMIEDTF